MFVCGTCSDAIVAGVSNFGLFVEIAPGVRGLCHISELDINRTPSTDAWENGDVITVKLIEVRCPACHAFVLGIDCRNVGGLQGSPLHRGSPLFVSQRGPQCLPRSV